MPISGGDNGGDTTSVMVPEEAYVLSVVGYEAVVNLPTVNSTEAGNSDNNTKVKITTTIDAAIKTQCFATGAAIAMRGKLTTAEHILINTGGDKDHVDLYRGLRMRNKMIRCSISQRVTGSRRRYTEALVIGLPSAIVIQPNVRRLFAITLVSKLKESASCDSSVTSYAPSSGLSQSPMTTKELEIASMNDGENGKVLDDSNEFDWNGFMVMPNTTKYTALKNSWGGQLSQQSYNHHDNNNKTEIL